MDNLPCLHVFGLCENTCNCFAQTDMYIARPVASPTRPGTSHGYTPLTLRCKGDENWQTSKLGWRWIFKNKQTNKQQPLSGVGLLSARPVLCATCFKIPQLLLLPAFSCSAVIDRCCCLKMDYRDGLYNVILEQWKSFSLHQRYHDLALLFIYLFIFTLPVWHRASEHRRKRELESYWCRFDFVLIFLFAFTAMQSAQANRSTVLNNWGLRDLLGGPIVATW